MIGVSFLMFDLNYYFMSTFPGARDFMCVIGGNLTPLNIIFAIFLSLMTGILIAGIVELFRLRSKKLAASSVTGLGLFLGILTMFCAACTIPVITIAGFSIGISFLTTYNLIIQISSMILMLLALYLVNQQLNDACVVCKIDKNNC